MTELGRKETSQRSIFWITVAWYLMEWVGYIRACRKVNRSTGCFDNIVRHHLTLAPLAGLNRFRIDCWAGCEASDCTSYIWVTNQSVLSTLNNPIAPSAKIFRMQLSALRLVKHNRPLQSRWTITTQITPITDCKPRDSINVTQNISNSFCDCLVVTLRIDAMSVHGKLSGYNKIW